MVSAWLLDARKANIATLGRCGQSSVLMKQDGTNQSGYC